jgi:hypothetical protein
LYGIACIILFYFWADLQNGMWALAFLPFFAPIVLLPLVYGAFCVLKLCILGLSFFGDFVVDLLKKAVKKVKREDN